MKLALLFSCLGNAILLARVWSLLAIREDLEYRVRIAERNLTLELNKRKQT